MMMGSGVSNRRGPRRRRHQQECRLGYPALARGGDVGGRSYAPGDEVPALYPVEEQAGR